MAGSLWGLGGSSCEQPGEPWKRRRFCSGTFLLLNVIFGLVSLVSNQLDTLARTNSERSFSTEKADCSWNVLCDAVVTFSSQRQTSIMAPRGARCVYTQ